MKAAPKAEAKAATARVTKATAAELIESGAPEIGTKLTTIYKGTKVNARIAHTDGRVTLGWKLHALPCAAAKVVSGNAETAASS